ncbi:MAG TPA: EamA family transporter [Cyanobacteria bacterium UBA8553]|nr:EamA family transporter [Cyanobacteria bacterium UBA8553]
MSRLATNISDLINQIPGRVYLMLAILIFGAANSITRKLTEVGAQNLIDGRNPISFCNVLFVGNLCALMMLGFIYWKQWKTYSLRQLSRTDWLSLIGVAILAGALAPALIFLALSLTMVNNVVLIGRIEPPLILALSVWLLRERVNRWVIAGSVISFVGVVLTIVLQKPEGNMVDMGGGIQVGKGELMAAAGAVFLAISTIISKVKLRQIPLGIFSIIRAVIGTVVFFAIALKLFGPAHFMDVFSPFLWQWMLLYSAVIVVAGQLFWLTGLKKTSTSEVSLASAFNPIVGILAAYFILGEAPTFAQYIGGGIVLCGIVLNQIGVSRQSVETTAKSQVDSAKEMDMEAGFKGL